MARISLFGPCLSCGSSCLTTNYCTRALADRGWVKMVNFGRSGNRAAYVYKLTPTGIRAKARAARRFLAHKWEEHERLAGEIERLHAEVIAVEKKID